MSTQAALYVSNTASFPLEQYGTGQVSTGTFPLGPKGVQRIHKNVM